jgi:hypothetical protein
MVSNKALYLESFKTQVSTVEKFLTVAKPSFNRTLIPLSLNFWHGLNQDFNFYNFNIQVSIKSLNFDNFNIQVSTVKNFFTVSIPKSQQSHYPKVSIFGMVLIVSLNLNCFKTHDLTVEKFVTVEIFLTVLKPKSW